MTHQQSLSHVLRWPAVIAGLTLAGLLSALIGDGVWDGVSWALLAVPAGIGVVQGCRPGATNKIK